MLSAKQFTIVLTAALCICIGTIYGKNLLSLFPKFASGDAETEATDGKTAIQVALLLDTSGSMSGLIEQAKSQLWKILNELNRMKKNGETPSLEIALYEYGNPSKASGKHEIHQLTPFTTDMDLVSEKLFSLTTNGGDEYCGTVIQAALDELEWKRNDGMRIIYIAGNEPFTQGPVGYAGACGNALQKDIIVNTIHCGECETGVRDAWQAGAKAGGGEYLCIDQNQQTVYIETPYDADINRLNIKLNDTYIPLGKKGEEKKFNQSKQDENAAGYAQSNAAERSAFKSSKNYKAEEWDLVDAYKKDKKVMENKAELPETLQNISIEEMEAKIQAIAAERESIQQQMQDLDTKRRRHIREQSAKNAGGDLEESILKSLRKQAETKGFEING